MFADPQTVTVNAVAKSLAAVSRADGRSVYQTDDRAYIFEIARTYAQNRRFLVKLTATKTAADPLTTANNKVYQTSCWLAINAPLVGYSNQEVRDIARGLCDWVTPAILLRVIGGET